MIGKFLLVTTGFIFSSVSLSPGFAAERVILSYGGITIADAATEQIVDFVKTGEASPAVQSYLQYSELKFSASSVSSQFRGIDFLSYVK